MTDVIPIDDGYGGRLGDRCPMPAKPGSHVAYARGSDLVVEWYDFGDHAPYESANLLIFCRSAQRLLAAAIDVDVALSPHLLSNEVASRFQSYFEVKEFATERGIPFEPRPTSCPRPAAALPGPAVPGVRARR
jgi:hypothetical protein